MSKGHASGIVMRTSRYLLRLSVCVSAGIIVLDLLPGISDIYRRTERLLGVGEAVFWWIVGSTAALPFLFLVSAVATFFYNRALTEGRLAIRSSVVWVDFSLTIIWPLILLLVVIAAHPAWI